MKLQEIIEQEQDAFRELNKEMLWVAEEEVDDVLTHLHQSQLKLLAGIREMIGEVMDKKIGQAKGFSEAAEVGLENAKHDLLSLLPETKEEGK